MSKIFIISGVPGSGKSTIAKALIQQFNKGIHIPLDDLREWVISGIAHPVPEWTDETTRQFHLAFRSAADIAVNYAEAGFSVAIDQVLYPSDVNTFFNPRLTKFGLTKICLLPGLEDCLERNTLRTSKDFDTSVLQAPIKAMYSSFSAGIHREKDWIIIDNSNLSVGDTVDQILDQIRK